MRNVKKWLCMLLAGVLCCVMLLVSAGCDKIGHKHSYGEWKVKTEPKCNEEGTKERTCACGEVEREGTGFLSEHTSLEDKIHNAEYGDSYADLFSLYTKVMEHQKKYNCQMTRYFPEENIGRFVEDKLFLGKWVDDDGKSLWRTYAYEDYENTYGSVWFGHDLPSSEVSGNDYYYYTEFKDGKLVIGYEDTITREKTDNFVITFEKDHISVENLIDKKTYVMQQDPDFAKVEKGNAQYAYYCLAKNINYFKNPSAVRVTGCHVDYDEHVVYAVIESTNSYGGIVSADYKLYESEGRYYIEEYNHNYSTNIDLEELNTKLATLVK